MGTSRPPRPPDCFLALHVKRFAAQVLSAWTPELRNRPFTVIRQNAENQRTTVWTCSAAAEAIGIRPGTPVHVLRKYFPTVKILPRDTGLEETARAEIAALAEQYTPDFLVRDNGRALFNLTGTPAVRNGGPVGTAEAICFELSKRTGLTEVSAGISAARGTAGILAAHAEAGEVLLCRPGEEERALGGIPVRRMPGLPPVCRRKLADYGLKTIGDVQRLSKAFLVSRLGPPGEQVYSLCRGLDTPERRKQKASISAEAVFRHDLNDEKAILNYIRNATDKLCHGLRTESVKTGGITCRITYSDGKNAQRTIFFKNPTDDFEKITAAAKGLFESLYQRRVALKSMRLTAPRVRTDTGQLNLFETVRENKQKAVGECLYRIRCKSGFESIGSGARLENND